MEAAAKLIEMLGGESSFYAILNRIRRLKWKRKII